MTRPGPPTAAEYLDLIDTWNAETQRLCTEQPEQAGVRHALLAAEKRCHDKGWDGPPDVFYLARHPRTGKVRYRRFDKWSTMLVDLAARPRDVLAVLAEVAEMTRAAVSHHVYPGDLDGPVGVVAAALLDSFSRGADPDGDLFTGSHDIFHGIGFTTEAWLVMGGNSLADRKYIDALAQSRQLHSHPDRREIRSVLYAARDGYFWDVQRFRRVPDLALPRFVRVRTQDDEGPTAGSVPRSLTRMCNAIASNPVPLASYGEIV